MRFRKVILIIVSSLLYSQLEASEKIKFDFDWLFHLGEDAEAMKPDFSPHDWKWENVQLPHDWSIHQSFNESYGAESGYLPGGIGLYRKNFFIPKSYIGKSISLYFDGVYHKATVYINGMRIGYHRYGYTGFGYEISRYLKYGSVNSVTLHVDHSEKSRWYTGSGIYRHVWLVVANPIHIPIYGTYITTPRVNKQNAVVQIKTTIANTSSKTRIIKVMQILLDTDGRSVKKQIKESVVINANDTINLSQSITLLAPQLWSEVTPKRYFMKTIIKEGAKSIDSYISPFGVRTFAFDCNTGFSLNGVRMKLRGACIHQDNGGLGVAIPDRIYEMRLKKLKSLGFNAIRCSHNPPSPELLEICDTLGLLVIDEAFDKWKSGYYENFYDECWRQNISEMLIRDRNHPSVIVWSLGNETRECQLDTDEGVDRVRMMVHFVHDNESTRPVMVANQFLFRDKFANELDIVGYNYQEPRMIEDHLKYPHRVMIVSEAYPYYSSDTSRRIREYLPYNPWNYVQNNDFIAGSFVWAGIDYLGESSGWPSKGWPSCPLDMTLDERPVAAYYHAVWDKKPYVKLVFFDPSLNMDPGKDHWQYPFVADHLNFAYNDERVIEFRTITNCDSVRLIAPHNGRMLDFGTRKTSDYIGNEIVWMQPARHGKMIAVGYKNGRESCRDSLVTTGLVNTIKIVPNRCALTADGEDVCVIKLELYDSDGRMVQTDDQIVSVDVTGEGRLLALDNGDMRRTSRFGVNAIKTYLGKAQLILQSTRKCGIIKIIVKMKDKIYITQITTNK
jgi:beta-galactosidase